MKVKTIINISSGLIALGGASAGTYYALNSKATKPNLDESKKKEDNQQQTIKGTKKIKEILIGDQFTLLNTTDTNVHDKEWKSLIEKFVSGRLSDDEKITALINFTSEPTKDFPTNIANLKKACNDLLDKTESDGNEFTKNKKLAETWCTAQSELLKEVPAVLGAVSPA